jgi:hypothetical protein
MSKRVKLFWFFYGFMRFYNSRYWSIIKAWDMVILKRRAYIHKEARVEQDKDD